MEVFAFGSYMVIWWLFFSYRYPKFPGGWDDVVWGLYMALIFAGGVSIAAIAESNGDHPVASAGMIAILALAVLIDFVAWRKRPGDGSYLPLAGPRRSGNGRTRDAGVA